MHKIAVFLIFEVVAMGGLGVTATIHIDSQDYLTGQISSNDTEYWALLVGCNEFINMPSARLIGNDVTARDLYNTLLVSDHWKEQNIRLLTGKNATSINILKGLRWLDKMDDDDDICLFYIGTHGVPGPDYFPKDEADGMDEWLDTYSTFKWWFPQLGGAICIPYLHRLSDDQINFMLSLLDSKGVCVIIDACYSGGFNDPPYQRCITSFTSGDKYQEYTSDDFMNGFLEELRGSGRVVLMSTTEDKVTLTWFFAHCIMEGLQGFGNIREDTMVSAEEAFEYGAPLTTEWLQRKYGELFEPQILDDYEGDLLLTDINLPPERIDFSGEMNGKLNEDCYYVISSVDPEGDRIRYYIDWGDYSEEWTDFVASGESVNLQHSWEKPGTYNVWYNNVDEHGVVYSFGPLFDYMTVSITGNDGEVDQKQTLFFDGADVNDGLFTNKIWLAQSFVPNYPTLSKVDLLISTSSYYVGPMTLSIRSNLTGEDLTKVSVTPNVIDNWFTESIKWTIFDLPDVNVVPGETYYLIIHYDQSNSIGAWLHVNSDCGFHPDYQDDPYQNGMTFLSKNFGRTWTEYFKINDFCFVTYGE